MGIPERKEREREARRALFTDAAESLFAERGFEGTTIDQITRRAEFSKRTFYLYFENKTDVFAAVALRALDRLERRMERALDSAEAPLERVRGLAWAYFRFFEQERSHFDTHLRFEEDAYHYRKAAFGSGPHARRYIERVAARDERIYALFDEAIASGAVRTDLTGQQLLLVVWGQCAGTLRMIAAREAALEPFYGTTPETLFAAAVELMLAGLERKGGDRVTSMLRSFFVRDDPDYDRYVERYQARTPGAKALYLFLHFLPGIVAVVLLNIEPVYRAVRELSGMGDKSLQYVLFIVVTYGWHTLFPVVVLMRGDGLSFRETMGYLGLDRIDWKGLFVVLPVLFVPYTLVSAPYFRWVEPALTDFLGSIPAFQIPDHSLFKSGLYDFPPVLLLFLLIGNFLGEEVYYRGYLMKKCGFLGRHTWWITSLLFALYHLWQIPHTWPLFAPAIVFGLVMVLRKNLYVVILLHLLLNLWWVGFMESTFGP